MTERPDHTSHDRLLIAAYAAGDVTGPDLARAEALLGSCHECAELRADLAAIAQATPAAAVPRRPRDFRLRPADVESAPSRGLVSRFGRSLGSFRRSLVPVGAGLATIGIAGLLLAGTTGLFGGSSAAILSTVGSSVGGNGYGSSRDVDTGGGPSPAAAASAPEASAMAPEVPDTGAGASPLAGGGAAQSLLPAKGTDGQEAGPVPARPSTPAAGPSPLVLGAIGLVLVGAVLLGLGLSLGNRASPPD